jgi:hypothetical protein
VDELDAGVRGAGQIVGDYSDEHLSISACEHFSMSAAPADASACQHFRFFGRRRFSIEQVLL